MEVTEDIKVAPHQDQPKEKDGIVEDEIVPHLEAEHSLVPHIEDEHSPEDLKDKDLQIETEKETTEEEYKAQDARTAGESQKDPVKKPKEDAQSSSDIEFFRPHFSGVARETHKTGHENSAAATIKRSLTSKVSGRQEGDNKDEVGVKNQRKIKAIKEEKRNLQVPMKQQEQKGETAESRKLGTSSTFKALPLPSFYHKSDPAAKTSTKKVSSTGPKSPPLGQRSKHSSPASDAQKKTIGNSTKQTINKLLRSARKALNPSKETVKSVIVTA